MRDAPPRDAKAAHIEAYKTILRNVLDERPSGTRQRLANALGKNRSFISHICNPAYPVPIPARHLEIIFEICHFPRAQKRLFLESFERAHPNRSRQVRESPSLRSLNSRSKTSATRKRIAHSTNWCARPAVGLLSLSDTPIELPLCSL
jgi:hypothetical protein